MRQMNDTTPEVADLVQERLMARPGYERVLMGSLMFDAARTIVLASFPPELSDVEVKARLCKRMYGEEVDVDGFIAHLARLR